MSVYYFNITYRCNSNCIFCAANHPIDKSEKEMSLDEFDNILTEHNVSNHDRVIINGGEPTVHREFWKMLDAVKSHGAKIDIFTNGIKCQDEEFVDRLLDYDYIHIRIPLFGSTPERHDFLTGRKGNFEAIIKSLDNISSKIRGHASAEIKLLLSKATVDDNEGIYKLILSRWSESKFSITLNPLLISKCVIEQKDIMIADYNELMRKSEPLIRLALKSGADFSVGLVPYCSFPNEELLSMCRGSVSVSNDFFYASPGYSNNVAKLEYRKRCLECKYVDECNGFSKNYIDYFGDSVIKPFLM